MLFARGHLSDRMGPQSSYSRTHEAHLTNTSHKVILNQQLLNIYEMHTMCFDSTHFDSDTILFHIFLMNMRLPLL